MDQHHLVAKSKLNTDPLVMAFEDVFKTIVGVLSNRYTLPSSAT